MRAAAQQLGGEEIALGEQLWRTVRDHTHEYFDNARSQIAAQQDYTLWRVSVADHTPTIELPGDWLYEWAGAQRWLLTNVAPSTVFQAATAAGGHAMRYSPGPVGQPAFQPLNGALLRLQARLRDSFDPQRLFNPGRFHPEMDTLGHANGNTTAAVGA